MKQYSMNLQKLKKEFNNEKQCLEFLLRLRWPDGYCCPRCQHNKEWQVKEFKYKCQRCGYQTSVTSGTLFQDTQQKLLPTWFRAIWYITSQKQATSAFGLQKELGLGSYRTAWTWMHKLRSAMIHSKKDILRGTVEFSMYMISWTSRGTEYTVTVAIVVEINKKKIGCIRMNVFEKPSLDSAYTFIENCVGLGSTIIASDIYRGYMDFSDKGYIQNYCSALEHADDIISQLRKWLSDKTQGLSSKDYIAYYLDEYCFKFNRQNYKCRGQLFYELLQNAVQLEPIPYKEIVSK